MLDKTYFESMPKYRDFKFWFIPKFNHNKNIVYEVYQDHSIIDQIEYDNTTDQLLMDNHIGIDYGSIQDSFTLYKSRPEFSLGQYITISPSYPEYMIDDYEKLIVGCMMIRSFLVKKAPDNYITRIQEILDWLRSTDFYTAPASAIYHESYSSGLLIHTMQVINNIYELRTISKFKNCRLDSAVLVALVHDWCKIGLYSTYEKNVKNEITGQWEKQLAYRRNNPAIPLGHGVESLYKAMKCFNLSEEECAAIRWHMGAWNVAPNEMNDLQTANEKYPLVHLIQFADQLSIVKYDE